MSIVMNLSWVRVLSLDWDGFEVSGSIFFRAFLLRLLIGVNFVGASHFWHCVK